MHTLQSIDNQILFLINGLHNSFFDYWMFQFSQKFFWLPLYLVLIFYIFRLYGKNGFIIIIGAILTIALCDQIASHLIKNLVQRLRPSHQPELEHLLRFVNDYKGGDYGFISSHAANSLGLATFLYPFYKSKIKILGVILFIVAIIISYSRIYLGVHFPSDVLCGNLLGICIGYILSQIIMKSKLKSIIFPNE